MPGFSLFLDLSEGRLIKGHSVTQGSMGRKVPKSLGLFGSRTIKRLNFDVQYSVQWHLKD